MGQCGIHSDICSKARASFWTSRVFLSAGAKINCLFLSLNSNLNEKLYFKPDLQCSFILCFSGIREIFCPIAYYFIALHGITTSILLYENYLFSGKLKQVQNYLSIVEEQFVPSKLPLPLFFHLNLAVPCFLYNFN